MQAKSKRNKNTFFDQTALHGNRISSKAFDIVKQAFSRKLLLQSVKNVVNEKNKKESVRSERNSVLDYDG